MLVKRLVQLQFWRDKVHKLQQVVFFPELNRIIDSVNLSGEQNLVHGA